MSNTPTVLLDVDGVIAAFAENYRRIAQSITNRPLPPLGHRKLWDVGDDLGLSKRERAYVDSQLHKPGAASELQELHNAVIGVKGLLPLADIIFVTSPIEVAPTWVHDRQCWLLKRFGSEHTRVIHTYYKEYVSGDFLIDDKPSNIEKWMTGKAALPGAKAILWAHVFNEGSEVADLDGVTRTNCWSQVRKMIINWKDERAL